MDPPALYKRALGVSKLIHGAFRDTCFVRTDKIPHPLINLSFVKEKKKISNCAFLCLSFCGSVDSAGDQTQRLEEKDEKRKQKPKKKTRNARVWRPSLTRKSRPPISVFYLSVKM